MKAFRILSLTGGGARGLFQAHYLNRLAESDNDALHKRFDLIAGTSVGSINGLVVSLQIPTKSAVQLFEETLPVLFTPKRYKGGVGKYIFAGAIYNQDFLRAALRPILDSRTIGDCKTFFLAPAVSLSGFKAKLFSNPPRNENERHIKAIDVALASAAAPTYFDPVRLPDLAQSFLDGGLWANSPSLAAVLFAHNRLKVPFSDMRLLSIGTGRYPSGSTMNEFKKMRPISQSSITAIFDAMFASQHDFFDRSARELIGDDNLIQIDCNLRDNIPLDDADSAIKMLPDLASETFDSTSERVLSIFRLSSEKYPTSS
jgi:uncharacterized protein